MQWIIVLIIMIVCVILVIGAIIGLLFILGVFELSKQKKASGDKLTAIITQGNDQTVNVINKNTVVHFTYSKTEYVSDTKNQRSITFYPNGKGSIPPGCLVYVPGDGPSTSNFLFTAKIDAGSNKTNMGVYLNGVLMEGTSTGVGSPVSISVSVTLGANDVVGLYDLYLGDKSQWKAGSYYKLIEQ